MTSLLVSYQALQEIQRRMRELLDDLGFTDRAIIDKYLHPLLEATETKFFPYRKEIVKKPRKLSKNDAAAAEPTVETVQVIDERKVIALGTRTAALNSKSEPSLDSQNRVENSLT
jgi:hypothetical protein